MYRTLRVCGIATALSFCAFLGQAGASTILLDLEDPPSQTNTPFALNLVATSTSTDITIAGYDVPGYYLVTGIQLTTGGGSNLLGLTWLFTPAPSGSFAFQFNDLLGTGTNGLVLQGVVEDSFDQFSQTVSTVVGQIYSLQFFVDTAGNTVPSELLVTTSGAAVPEPGTLTLLGAGVIGVAARLRRRRLAQR